VIELGTAPQRFMPPEREMPDNAVFISYAREDLPAVQKLKAGLDAAGVKTWFDLERLEGGDDYDRKIQRKRRAAARISSRSSRQPPSVALKATSGVNGATRSTAPATSPKAALFVMPVTIDDTNGGDAQVPEKFKAVHFHAFARRRSHTRIRAAG